MNITLVFIKDIREKTLDFSREMNHDLVIFFPCNNLLFNV